MKQKRHNKILELITNQNIETQEELVEELNKDGYNVSQATVSRDIKELRLIKVQSDHDTYKYATELPSPLNQGKQLERFAQILKDSITSVTYSNNIIVVKTISGFSDAACEALDIMNIKNILGTIAGENTFFIVTSGDEQTPGIVKQLKQLIK